MKNTIGGTTNNAGRFDKTDSDETVSGSNSLCESTREALADAKALTDTQKAHVKQCRFCQSFQNETEKLLADLAALDISPVKNGTSLADAVMEEIDKQAVFGRTPSAKASKPWLFRHAGLAAACLIVFVLAAPTVFNTMRVQKNETLRSETALPKAVLSAGNSTADNQASAADESDESLTKSNNFFLSADTSGTDTVEGADAAPSDDSLASDNADSAPDIAAETLDTAQIRQSVMPPESVSVTDSYTAPGIETNQTYADNFNGWTENASADNSVGTNDAASDALPDNFDSGPLFQLKTADSATADGGADNSLPDNASNAETPESNSSDSSVFSVSPDTDGHRGGGGSANGGGGSANSITDSSQTQESNQDLTNDTVENADSAIRNEYPDNSDPSDRADNAVLVPSFVQTACDATNAHFGSRYSVQSDAATFTTLSETSLYVDFALEHDVHLQVFMTLSDGEWKVAVDKDGKEQIFEVTARYNLVD